MSGAATDNVDDRSSAEGSAKAPAAAIVERAAKLRQLLSDRTGEAKPALIVRAPGRVNLIGEYPTSTLASCCRRQLTSRSGSPWCRGTDRR